MTQQGGYSPSRETHLSMADELKARIEITRAFCDSAKNYIQISAAALALPLVFTQAVIGREAKEKGIGAVGLTNTLVISWICFLLAIGFGLAYQWLAVRRVWDELHRIQFDDRKAAEPGFRLTKWIPQLKNLNRSFVYGGMVTFFYLGALFFVFFACLRMRS